MSGHKTLIDYLSFTWAPTELRQMVELAKQGALLKAIPRFDTQNKAIQAALSAPPVEGLRYLWKRPVGFAPLARFDKVTERLYDKAERLGVAPAPATVARVYDKASERVSLKGIAKSPAPSLPVHDRNDGAGLALQLQIPGRHAQRAQSRLR